MFSDRRDAGRRLADRLVTLRREDPIIVSLPYGAVLVADEVADRLQAPLRLMLVRRVRTPGTRQILGAVAERGQVALDPRTHVAPQDMKEQVALESVELYRRSSAVRRWMPPIVVGRRTVILVDDGSSPAPVVQAALMALRAERPGKIVMATPITDQSALERLRSQVDDVVFVQKSTTPVHAPDHYESFEAVGDDAVMEMLRERGM